MSSVADNMSKTVPFANILKATHLHSVVETIDCSVVSELDIKKYFFHIITLCTMFILVFMCTFVQFHW